MTLRSAVTPFLLSIVLLQSASPARAEDGAVPVDIAPVHDRLDLATTEELALYFAEESIRRLPISLGMRLLMKIFDEPGKKERIEKLRRNPPRADARGRVYPFGDSNPLSFVFDAERGTLTVWERLATYEGVTSRWGLTVPEMAAELNGGSNWAERGGGRFGWDQELDALSLQRRYSAPPQDRDRFYRDVAALLEARSWWSAKARFVEMSDEIAERHRPPASATASSTASTSEGGFEATLVLRHFSAPPGESAPWVGRFVRGWDFDSGAAPHFIVSDRSVEIGQTLHAFVLFRGAEIDADGKASVDGRFRLTGPGGLLATYETPLWRDKAPLDDRLQLGERMMSPILTSGSPLGPHRVEAEICDLVADECVVLAHEFELVGSSAEPLRIGPGPAALRGDPLVDHPLEDR